MRVYNSDVILFVLNNMTNSPEEFKYDESDVGVYYSWTYEVLESGFYEFDVVHVNRFDKTTEQIASSVTLADVVEIISSHRPERQTRI